MCVCVWIHTHQYHLDMYPQLYPTIMVSLKYYYYYYLLALNPSYWRVVYSKAGNFHLRYACLYSMIVCIPIAEHVEVVDRLSVYIHSRLV